MSILRNFAVLEGCDGSGTTTQLTLLSRRFARGGLLPDGKFYATAEPTKGPVGKLIRHVLRGGDSLAPETIARLFAADRAEHLYGSGGIVRRCAILGELVVSDRYSLSSLVYQAVDCGEELPRILNELFPLPELLIYLDIDTETAIRRIAGRPERELFEYREFQEKARDNYKKLLPVWEKNGVTVAILDGARFPEDIAEEVWSAVKEMPILKGTV
ncbi:MAG: dTMP kinase [Treponema sp.]|jgi:dTMP kinase|nr:dTMP kinase [Treponema sp.]